jgi:serine/threonine-protein kinase
MSSPLPPNSWPAAIELFSQLAELDTAARDRELEASRLPAAILTEVRSLLAAHDAAGDKFERLAALELLGIAEPPAAISLTGRRVGAWEVGAKVGEGGMGAVYEAVRADDAVRQRVALKTIARGADSESIVQRFKRERQILAGLQHPHIATLLDAGVTEFGTPYFAMEFVDGQPIDVWCAERHLGLAARLDLFQQVCAAVEHAHQRLVVHRDLKPGNILVSGDGVVKLVDFGIAKLVEAGVHGETTTLGLTPITLAYASPEQARGEPVSTATDIYSLGAVLYRVLAGVAPFATAGRPPAELLHDVTTAEPPLPSTACTVEAAARSGFGDRTRLVRALAGELDAIVMMAMRKDPRRRYASVAALGEDVRRYLRGLPVAARPDSVGYRFRKFVSRRRGVVVAGSAALLSIATFSGIAVWQARAARAEATRTQRVSQFLQSVLGAGDLVSSGGAITLGPRASMSVLLDSAVRRIPLEFADEPAVRARLYTSMATGLMSQSRMTEAAHLLDSARALALAAGARPDFARASVEAGVAATHRDRLDDAQRYFDDAEHTLTSLHAEATELFARLLLDRSAVHLLRGEWETTRALALRADSIEQRRTTGPTFQKAVALNRLSAYEFFKGRLAAADAGYTRTLAMMEAAGAPWGLERIGALSNATIVASFVGNVPRADSLALLGLTRASEAFGAESREAALFHYKVAYQLLRRGEVPAAEATLRRAVRIIDSVPDVVPMLRREVDMGLIEFLVEQHRWHEADSALAAHVAHTGEPADPFGRSMIYLYWGNVRAARRDFPSSEDYLTRAEREFVRSGVVSPAVQLLIRGNLASLYVRTERPLLAAPYLDSLPPSLQAGVRAFAARERQADAVVLRRLARSRR